MTPVPQTPKNLMNAKLPSSGLSNRGRPLEGGSASIRDVRIIVRMTREEREDVRRWAKDRGMSTAAWVRDVIGLPQPKKERLEVTDVRTD